MATHSKKPGDKGSEAKAAGPKKLPAKKPPKKKVAAAAAGAPAVRQAPARETAPPITAAKTAAVLVNAVTPDERLADPALMQRAVATIEQSWKTVVPAAVAVNRKLVDIAQANVNSGLELARDLAGAKSPIEMVRLGMTYWNEHMDVFRAQAEELRALQAAFVAKASEPLRAQIRRA